MMYMVTGKKIQCSFFVYRCLRFTVYRWAFRELSDFKEGCDEVTYFSLREVMTILFLV